MLWGILADIEIVNRDVVGGGHEVKGRIVRQI